MKKSAFLHFFFLIILGLGSTAPLQAADNARSDVNAFDRGLMSPYSLALDVTGDVFQYLTIAAPFALAAVTPKSDWLRLTLMYGESAALAFGASTLTKLLVERDRPYTYFDGAPDANDAHQSFFSRHTTMAFNGAAFTSVVFSHYFPDSPWTPWVWAGTFGLATATGILRIAGGSHFLTDVLVGAVVGGATGFLVPWLQFRYDKHWKERSGPVLSVSPGEVRVTFFR
jgi:undecaprenyl-diphosphatase